MSQTEAAANAGSTIRDSSSHKIQIDFTVRDTVSNLLVRINDIRGITLFFDNRYRFSGHYSEVVDLSRQKNGVYFLELIMDDDHTTKNILLE